MLSILKLTGCLYIHMYVDESKTRAIYLFQFFNFALAYVNMHWEWWWWCGIEFMRLFEIQEPNYWNSNFLFVWWFLLLFLLKSLIATVMALAVKFNSMQNCWPSKKYAEFSDNLILSATKTFAVFAWIM